MARATTTKLLTNRQLSRVQKRILDAYIRGLLSGEQAMRRLGLRDHEELKAMLRRLGVTGEPKKSGPANGEDAQKQDSIADGFVSYWLSQEE